MEPHKLRHKNSIKVFFTEVFALCFRPITQSFPGALLGRGKRIKCKNSPSP